MSFPYFSFFIGDLPGEPTSIFALDAAAPSWTGASFEAFNASKWNGTSDAFRLAEGLRSCVKAHYDESGQQDGYLVTIYDDPLHPDDSAKKTVFVNDVYAKGNLKGGKPTFASLFEAAYGQIHPGGTRPSGGAGPSGIEGGSPGEALKDVTGKDARRIRRRGDFLGLFGGFPPDARETIAKDVRNHPMVASTDARLSGFERGEGHAMVSIDGKRQNIKIASGHAYAIVGADKKGVTLYNPWGHNDPANGGSPCAGKFTMSWGDFENTTET